MGIPLAESIPAIAGWLPISEDSDEAGYIFPYLCDLLDAYVFGCIPQPSQEGGSRYGAGDPGQAP